MVIYKIEKDKINQVRRKLGTLGHLCLFFVEKHPSRQGRGRRPHGSIGEFGLPVRGTFVPLTGQHPGGIQ
jgi:hypothetical protein